MKKIIFFLFSFFMFIVCGCTDTNEKSTENTAIYFKAAPEMVSAEQVLREINDTKIRNAIIKHITNHNALYRTTEEIEEEMFEKIVLEEYTNYTLELSKYSDEQSYFLYLLITKDNYNVEKSGYLKYTPNEPIEELKIKTFSGTMQLLDLELNIAAQAQLDNGTSSYTSMWSENCTTTMSIVEVECSNGGHHGVGVSCGSGLQNDAYLSVLLNTICTYSYTIDYNVPSTYISSSASLTNEQRFMNGLSDLQKDFIEDEENEEIVEELFDFLDRVGYASGTTLVKEILNQLILNPSLEFDVNASFKSPFLIDLSKVKGNTPEEIKFNSVYNKLMQSPKFKRLFYYLFNTTNFINARFKIEEIPNSPSGEEVSGTCQLFWWSNGQFLNEIKMDRSNLISQPEVSTAKTIIHECVHAYLNIKLRHPSIGMDIQDINDMDFTECINTCYDGFTLPESQHNFIADFMVETMAEILLDVKDQLIPAAQQFEVENPSNGGAFLYAPLTLNPQRFRILYCLGFGPIILNI